MLLENIRWYWLGVYHSEEDFFFLLCKYRILKYSPLYFLFPESPRGWLWAKGMKRWELANRAHRSEEDWFGSINNNLFEPPPLEIVGLHLYMYVVRRVSKNKVGARLLWKKARFEGWKQSMKVTENEAGFFFFVASKVTNWPVYQSDGNWKM